MSSKTIMMYGSNRSSSDILSGFKKYPIYWMIVMIRIKKKIGFARRIKYCLFISAMFFIRGIKAQEFTLTGKVLKEDDTPFEFITATLMKDGSLPIAETIGDSLGVFSIKVNKGTYHLKLSYLSRELFDKNLELENNIDLGVIKINESVALDEITIEGRKSLIERKIDRTVFNVENSIVSQGATAIDVIKNTPMVRVQNEQVSIVGKSSVGIMINGKIIHLSSEELYNYLESIRSERLASIEVITTPPSQYEAQGNGGLINIVLKKNTNMGINGNITTSYLQRSYAGTGNSATINYRSSVFSSSITLRQNFEALRTNERRDLISENSVLMSDLGKTTNKGYGLGARFDYKLNERSEIGVIYDFSRRHADRDITNRSIYETRGGPTDILNTLAQHRILTKTNTLNGYYDIKLDTLGKGLSFGINYLSNIPDGKIDLATNSELDTGAFENIRNTSAIDYGIWSGQVDLTMPGSWLSLDAGLKFTKFDNNSDVGFLELIDGNYVIDPAKSDVFEYDEKNYAAYISSNKKIGDRITLQFGLRYEYSFTDGYSKTTGSKTSSEYGKLFPTGYVKYDVNKSNTLVLSYSKRINRPQFRTLNPFRRYLNPNAYFTGNPLLRPSFSHNVSFGYSLGGKLDIDAYWMKIKDGYAPYQYLDENTIINTYGNFFDQENWGLNLSYSEKPRDWWSAYLSISSSYAIPNIREINAIAQKGLSFFYTINNTFTLNRSKNLSFLLNYDQGLSNRQTNFYSKSMADLSAGFRYSALGKKLVFNLMVNDIFRQQVTRGQVFFTDNTQYYNNYFDNRKLNFSISYNFGNEKAKQDSRKINFQEKSRAVN